jgi:hypothetical protein
MFAFGDMRSKYRIITVAVTPQLAVAVCFLSVDGAEQTEGSAHPAVILVTVKSPNEANRHRCNT